MFQKQSDREEISFWLSYTSLMAGLLFIFILLIGAIFLKSIVLKSNVEKDRKIEELNAQIILMQNISQEQKVKIKSVTGVKLKVIAELKESLGKNISFDTKSGSLRLSSNILFDKGSFILKERAKIELKNVFINYIGSLLSNKTVKNKLDRIVIEGHTDSDGTYLLNLNLSQQRAYAVMNYLLSLEFTKRNNLQALLVASGRSYLDTITNDKNQEDKLLSRRIEIKFRLKNDDAMYQIERILDSVPSTE